MSLIVLECFCAALGAFLGVFIGQLLFRREKVTKIDGPVLLGTGTMKEHYIEPKRKTVFRDKEIEAEEKG